MPDDVWDEYSIYEVDPANIHSGPEIALKPDNPEELFKRLLEKTNYDAAAGFGVSEAQRETLRKAWQDYQDWLRIQPAPGPSPLSRPAPTRIVSNQPPAEAKPPAQDSPQEQGAPDVQTSTRVEAQPSAARVSSRDPSAAARRQQDPLPPEIVVDMVTPPPSTDADRSALRDRVANNEPEAGQPHPTHAEPAARVPAYAGDPVDLFTGALMLAVSDLVVPTAVIPISMQRSYRSGPAYYGPFGRGWDHAYNVYLRPLSDGSLAFWTGRLQERRFHPTGVGWEPEPGVTARLERVVGAPDVFDIVRPGGIRWRLERPPGWGDAERIPLAGITDRHGNTVRLAYDSSDRLASVLDDAGRGVLFGYGQCDLLEQVADHTGTRVVRYEHDDQVEHLERVVLPATAEFPTGVATDYVYDRYAQHPAMRDNIIRVVDALGRTYLENEYAGPEVGWAFNSVARQISGGFEYQFEYEQLQYVPPEESYLDVPATRTSVGQPDGALHVHTFNYRGDLLDHRFRLDRDGSYRVVASQFGYDAQGNVTEAVGPDGVRHLMLYDAASSDPCARRNLLRADVASPLVGAGLSRILEQTQYEPRYQLPVRMTDEAGKHTRVVYDFDVGVPTATGRVVRVELPPVTLEDGSVQHSITHVEHNTRGQVTAVVSPKGSRTVMEYVVGGVHDGLLRRVVEDQTGGALATAYEYDSIGYPLRVTAPGGRVTGLRHNLLGQLEELVPPAIGGQTVSIRTWFGDDGSVVRVERPRGDYADAMLADPFLTDSFERDVLGRLTAAHLATNTAHGSDWRQSVDHEGRPLSAYDPTGARTDRRWDERGALLIQKRAPGTPDEAITRYSYDRAGRLQRMVDPLGRVTTIERDVWGRTKNVHLPSGATRTNRWGARDLLLETTVEGSPGPGLPPRILSRETYDYDERKRLRARTTWSFVDDPATSLALTTRYEHDMDDRLESVRLPRGSRVGLMHDGLARLTQITDEHGNTRDHSYDAAGDLHEVTVTEREGGVMRQSTWRYTYDDRGRLRAADGPRGRTEFDYDDRDEVIEQREPGGVTVRLATGPFGDLTERLFDPAGLAIRSRWSYDAAGRLAEYTDPTGAATTWERDGVGRVRVLRLPDGATWRHDFDLGGRRIEHITPSGTRVSYVLDDNDQPTRLECVASPGVDAVPTHEFAYDGLGRLVRATGPDGAIERRYDSVGRLVEETSHGQSVRFAYDDLTGAADLVFPDGRRERTHHDPTGRPVRVTLVTPGTLGGTGGEVLAAIGYAGRPASITHSNGVVTSLAYDDPGRLVRLEHSRSGVLLGTYHARYDERGRRALVQVSGAPARSTLHRFDAHDRLKEARWGFTLPALPDVASSADHAAAIAAATVAAAAASAGESYVLDSADGRTQRTSTRAGVAPVIEANVLAPDHKIVAAGGHPITYHADGHRATDARQSYDVDALGRVVRVRDTASGAIRAEFAYDALSRAATGMLDGKSFARWFVGATWVHETHGAAGGVRQASPHPLWPLPLFVMTDDETLFVHPDGGLSTLCLTDVVGAVRERHRYGPFGTPELFAGDGVTPIAPTATAVEPMWHGMPLVPLTGHYASSQRLYDPDLGVFLARDPMLYSDSPSPYVYASHNPVDFADPTGLAKSPIADQGTDAAKPSQMHSELWKWAYRQTGTWWYDPPARGDIFGQTPPVDTGSILENTVKNFWIGLVNLSARILNTPTNMFEFHNELGDRARTALRRWGVEDVDIQAFQDLSGAGLLRVEGLAEGAAALSAFLGGVVRGRLTSLPLRASHVEAEAIKAGASPSLPNLVPGTTIVPTSISAGPDPILQAAAQLREGELFPPALRNIRWRAGDPVTYPARGRYPKWGVVRRRIAVNAARDGNPLPIDPISPHRGGVPIDHIVPQRAHGLDPHNPARLWICDDWGWLEHAFFDSYAQGADIAGTRWVGPWE